MINKILKNPFNKFLLWISIGLLVCFIGISNTYALTTKTIYYSYGNGNLTGQNQYNYGYLNQGGIENSANASVGTTVNGQATGFYFLFYENIVLSNTYRVRVNFMSNDLVPQVNSGCFHIATCDSSSCDPVSLISITKSAGNSNVNSTWVDVNFNPTRVGNIIRYNIGCNNNPQLVTSVSNFGISSVQSEYTNQNEDIMNNANQNANNIIDNNNQNTQDIIDNQNQNTQDIMESQEVCSTLIIDKSLIIANGVLLDNGTTTSVTDGRGYTDYIAINNVKKLKNLLANTDGSNNYLCFYDENKSVISCISSFSYNNNQNIPVPSNTKYIRFTISGTQNRPQFELSYCKNGNQAMQDTITDDNVDSSSWANFFNNFTTNTFGLTSIITAPLNLIQSLTSTTCNDLQLPLPYLQNKYLTLPCMSSIYSQYFGTFFTLYQTITYGIIAYWVCVRIFNLVKDFKNPDHDEIEVVDL